MITVSNFSAGYWGRSKRKAFSPIVENLSFSTKAGEVTAIVGSSGSGKSTFLKALAGTIDGCSGEIHIETQHELPFWYSPQEPVFIEFRNILANVCAAREFRRQIECDEIGEAFKLLEGLGLGGGIKQRPSELSGGMKRRVALAQALYSESPILLLDEPFAELDIHTRRHAEAVFLSAQSDLKRTTIVVTHDLDSAAAIADRIVVFARDEKFVARSHGISHFLPKAKTSSATERRRSPAFSRAVGAIQEALIVAAEQTS